MINDMAQDRSSEESASDSRCGGSVPNRRIAAEVPGGPISLYEIIWSSPVFVVGVPRSGTTLVQTMLDSHPRLSVAYEANFLVDIPLGQRSWSANATEALRMVEAHTNFRSNSFDTALARAACRDLGITDAAGAMRALGASHAIAQNKVRWGNKTPKALLHLTELAAIFPDAQFIHVIRDGRDSAASQIGGDRSFVQNAILWRDGIRAGRRAESRVGSDRYLEVRLEEILLSPEKQIRQMCAFLGEQFHQSMMDFHVTARGRIPMSDLPSHPRLGEPPRPIPPRHESIEDNLERRAATALMESELVELGYIPIGSYSRRESGILRGIGYVLFLVALRKTWRELMRYFSRSLGARRAIRSTVRESSSTQRRQESAFQGQDIRLGAICPYPAWSARVALGLAVQFRS